MYSTQPSLLARREWPSVCAIVEKVRDENGWKMEEDNSGMGNLMMNYTREYGVGAHSSVYQVLSIPSSL